MLRFVEPSREMGCSFVNELVSGAEKIGVVWKSREADDFCSWALGDGSRQFGLASTIESAKAALVQASGETVPDLEDRTGAEIYFFDLRSKDDANA